MSPRPSGGGATHPPGPPEGAEEGRVDADVVIVGAGLAGLMAAHELPAGTRTVIVDKGVAGRSGSSPWAQGGMAAAVGPDDSPARHAADTVAAGDGLCDPLAVDVLTREVPARVAELLALGAGFDLADPDGPAEVDNLHLAREGGQHVARSVHTADATGAEMVRVLRRVVGPRVSRLEGDALRLERSAERVVGVHVRTPAGDDVAVRAGAVLLATGGCGALFAATTNQAGATGDGIALALLAGAALRDMAFVQFHPTGLATGGTWRFLLTEALRGAGATLHGADGERFLVGRHPLAELAPRHVVARAILEQPGGRALLDATGIGAERLATEFPTVLRGARDAGFDLARERVPVTPAAHYLVGGVRTDLHARTSVPGLWAAGEVASTGVHGANRMAGNSLAEALVFGARAAHAMTSEAAVPVRADDDVPPPPPAATEELHDAVRRILWEGAGPVRDGASLSRARERLEELAGGRPATACPAALITARLLVDAALVRRESRGGHHRVDHPDPDPALDGVHHEIVRTA